MIMMIVVVIGDGAHQNNIIIITKILIIIIIIISSSSSKTCLLNDFLEGQSVAAIEALEDQCLEERYLQVLLTYRDDVMVMVMM